MIKRIKEEIKQKGLKHGFVANKVGMSYKTFSAAMNGRRRITIEELVRISKVLDVPVEKLIEGVIEDDRITHTS
ncbi:helix-turn-helix domain-containing protein [Tindallia californiensis]|uniref:Helix-turn-helix n=1 Tax=Tindallia californiensis TaxID=159292 RepID=A0A1H3RET1_9FIRM|nr:helix-turn-helix transcriptional regulator [Tindallia californiensis]SDZ24187.1 Helix-turn-helix [Tindallia californiensis]